MCLISTGITFFYDFPQTKFEYPYLREATIGAFFMVKDGVMIFILSSVAIRMLLLECHVATRVFCIAYIIVSFLAAIFMIVVICVALDPSQNSSKYMLFPGLAAVIGVLLIGVWFTDSEIDIQMGYCTCDVDSSSAI